MIVEIESEMPVEDGDRTGCRYLDGTRPGDESSSVLLSLLSRNKVTLVVTVEKTSGETGRAGPWLAETQLSAEPSDVAEDRYRAGT